MTNTITKPKILVVDDEYLARARLIALLSELEVGVIIGEAENGVEALELIEQHQPDIVLMDIRMPRMDGLEAAQQLDEHEHGPAVIFTTAYGDHALEAFEAQALDYLLKPIKKERLEAAITRAQKMTQSILSSFQHETLNQPSAREYISAHHQGEITRIPVEEILVLHADQKYTEVITSEETYLIDTPLKKLEEEFHDQFLRIHRNTLVAKMAIDAFEKAHDQAEIRMRGLQKTFPVSRRLQSRVRKFVQG